MAGIKQFIFLHTEKVVLAAVLLVSLWSVVGTLLRNPNQLDRQNGDPYLVQPNDVRAWIGALKAHMELDKTFRTLPTPSLSGTVLEEMRDNVNLRIGWLRREDGRLISEPVDTEWVWYAQPPFVNISDVAEGSAAGGGRFAAPAPDAR